ncbi:fibronectin type III domain-containing protein, partial [Patescibacteria group bacterium]|nr:fibronectin type III domain-containing protein [Patescibacteria group bacterium]
GTTTSYGSTTAETDTSPRVTSHSVSLTGLSSCTTYHYEVGGVDGFLNQSTSTDQTFTTTCGGASPALTTSAATAVGTSTFTMNANLTSIGSSSVSQSGFAYGTSSSLTTGVSTTTLGAQSVGAFSQVLSGLLPATTYYFRAYAVNSYGTTTGSILSTTTLPWSPPGAPTGVSAATSSPSQATISFTAPASNGGSPILYYLASSTPGNKTATSTGSPIVVGGLSNGTAYTFQVYAVNQVGTSSASASSNSVTPLATPTLLAPTFSSVTASAATASSSITSTGGANATIEGFNWGTDTTYALGTTSTAGSFGISAFQTSTSTLTCNTTYHVRAFATNPAGTGYSSDSSFTTGACVSIPTVSTSNATLVSTSTMTLNGSIVSDGNASSTVRGFAWGTSATLGAGTATTTESGTFGTGSFSTSTLAFLPNTTYYFRAYAVNSSGTGYGSILSTTTLPWSPPGAPTGVSAATSSPSQATISFTAPASNGGSPILYYLAS